MPKEKAPVTRPAMMIDPEKVNEVFLACFFTNEEIANADKDENGIPLDAVVVEGIRSKFAFHPTRLGGHRAQIEDWLMALPTEFRKSAGGGWSFLQACLDREGNTWTGFHERMDQLFSLGQAIGMVQCQLPRKAWPSLPGGMPYYVILDTEESRVGG